MWQGALLLQNDLAYYTTSILSKKQTITQNYMVQSPLLHHHSTDQKQYSQSYRLNCTDLAQTIGIPDCRNREQLCYFPVYLLIHREQLCYFPVYLLIHREQLCYFPVYILIHREQLCYFPVYLLIHREQLCYFPVYILIHREQLLSTFMVSALTLAQ